MRHRLFNSLPSRIQAHISSIFPPFVSKFSVSLPNGKEIIFSDIEKSQIFKSLYWRGIQGYEKNTVKLFYVLSETSDCIFDIGAYFGLFSLIAEKANPDAKVIAFEPVPESFALLSKLISVNGASIKTENVALSNETGVTKFYMPDRSHSKIPNIGSLKNRFVPGEVFSDRGCFEIDVTCCTLDDFCNQRKISGIDLIKIDVEGLEAEIIQNGMEIIGKSKPDFVGEVSEYDGTDWCEALINIGYRLFDISDNGLHVISDIHQMENIDRTKSRGAFGEAFCSCKSDEEIEKINRYFSSL